MNFTFVYHFKVKDFKVLNYFELLTKYYEIDEKYLSILSLLNIKIPLYLLNWEKWF